MCALEFVATVTIAESIQSFTASLFILPVRDLGYSYMLLFSSFIL